MALNFKYCECGCKGYEASTGPTLHFWIFWDLEKSFHLHRGHGWFGGEPMGIYGTMEKAVEVATSIALEDLKSLKKSIDAAYKEIQKPAKK